MGCPSIEYRVKLVAGAAAVLLAGRAAAHDAPQHPHRRPASSISARLDRLERIIAEQQAEIHRLKAQVGAAQVAAQSGGAAQTTQSSEIADSQAAQIEAEVRDLKRAQSAQYADVQSKRQSDVQVSLKNGRPTFKTADGNFSASVRTLLQYDSAYYAQGKMPPGIDFSSGNDFRRARFGLSGALYRDWSYEFIYDFGGSGTETPSISSAFVQHDGLAPVHIRAGAYPPPVNFEDSTSAADLVFLERAQPADLERSIAGSDGRDGASIFAYDGDYYAALSFTGGLAGEAPVFDEQQALIGRAAYRFIDSDKANFVIGVDSNYAFKLGDLAAGNNSPETIRLRERPELNVDDQGIRLIDTGSLDASRVWTWGAEAAGNWRSLYGQAGYFHFDVDRRGSSLSNPNFNGWYAQASYMLTGESKPYKPDRGSYGSPMPLNEFSLDKGGWGAWELAARYSALDLNFDEGAAGLAAPPSGIRGGEQKIWTAGINWYPNDAVRFLLDYQHTDVDRLTAAGMDAGARLDAVSLRAQVAL